ncbi:MAG: PAS domain S-box protein [Bdellovibrionales bacterium]|nr:PAS domain S-box protein [Ramlibacter sp.]
MAQSPDTRPLASVPETTPMSFTDTLFEGRYARVLNPMLLVLLFGLPVLLSMSMWQGTNALHSSPLAVLLVMMIYSHWQLQRGRIYLVSNLLVFTVIAYTSVAILLFGSVRSAAVIGYAAAITAAGMMLHRKALIAAVLCSVVALGGLTWAEAAGRLGPANFSVGLRFWLAHVVVLSVVAVGVHAARGIVRQALVEQRTELGRRERAENNLRLSEDRFARIFRNSPVAIIVQSVDDTMVLDVNPAFERLYGWERSEMIGRSSDEDLWYSPDERGAFTTQLKAEGRISNFSTRGRRKDGSQFDALIASELEGTGPGQIVVSNITDVSAEVRAREEARQSQELFAKAFNFSPLNMTITRASDGTFLAVNSAEDTVQGYTAEELLGRTSLDAAAWLNASERESFIEKLRTNGQVLAFETQMRHRQGYLVHCRLWAVIVEIGGEPCVLSSTINITEQKRREGQLLELARGVAGETGERFFVSLVGHLATALDADLVMVGELTGESRLQSLALLQDGIQMPATDEPVEGTPCADAQEHTGLCNYPDEAVELFPQDRLLSEGNFRAFTGVALRDADGTPIGMLSAAWRSPQPPSEDRDALFSIFASRTNAELVRLRRDREIQRLHETLEQRVKDRTVKLQASNAEMESFSYSVSHDLKAPLSSIDGFAALLLRRMGSRMDAEENRMFERIRTNVGRMHELISALLSLAQVSRYKLELSDIDLSAMAQEWFDNQASREPERVVQTQVQPGLLARGDRRMARIVLDNLLGNAWKYSRKNPQARIEFGARGEGDAAVLFVSDNGVGFDMAHAGHMFKPFHRLNNVSEYDGSGIGLATVCRILLRHGGFILAESAVNEGATFLFSFDSRAAGT